MQERSQEKYSHFLGVFLEAGFVSARLVVAFGGLPRDSKGKTKQGKARESKGKQRKARDSKRKHVMLHVTCICESTAACDDILIAARAVSTSCTVEFVNARSSYFSTLGDVCFLSPAGGSINANNREKAVCRSALRCLPDWFAGSR